MATSPRFVDISAIFREPKVAALLGRLKEIQFDLEDRKPSCGLEAKISEALELLVFQLKYLHVSRNRRQGNVALAKSIGVLCS